MFAKSKFISIEKKKYFKQRFLKEGKTERRKKEKKERKK
jgi:hypothetical protein